MRYVLAALLALSLSFCATSDDPTAFRPFRACITSNHGGRTLFVLATVTGYRVDDNGKKVYRFIEDGTTEERDQLPSERVNRFCGPLSNMGNSGSGFRPADQQ